MKIADNSPLLLFHIIDIHYYECSKNATSFLKIIDSNKNQYLLVPEHLNPLHHTAHTETHPVQNAKPHCTQITLRIDHSPWLEFQLELSVPFSCCCCCCCFAYLPHTAQLNSMLLQQQLELATQSGVPQGETFKSVGFSWAVNLFFLVDTPAEPARCWSTDHDQLLMVAFLVEVLGSGSLLSFFRVPNWFLNLPDSWARKEGLFPPWVSTRWHSKGTLAPAPINR